MKAHRTRSFIGCLALASALAVDMTGASFDCAKARRGYEALICANVELSKADAALVDAYQRAHDALSSVGSQKEVKKAQRQLEKEQKEWAKTRQSKCPDVDCLRSEYQLRLATLRSYVSGNTPEALPRDANPPAVQATLPPSTSSNQPPEPAIAEQVNPQPPSSSQQPEPQSTPPPQEPVATGGSQTPSASETAVAQGNSLESVSQSAKHETEPAAADREKAEPSSPGLLSKIASGVSTGFSAVLWIVLFLYILWGAYWGCQIVYPRMLAWYKSSTWLIFGTGPMDILKRQIIFGLQVRFWAIVIGIVVGCLGGGFYMQYLRSRRTA